MEDVVKALRAKFNVDAEEIVHRDEQVVFNIPRILRAKSEAA